MEQRSETPEILVKATQPVVLGVPSRQEIRVPMSPADQAKYFDGATFDSHGGTLSLHDLGPDGAYRKLLLKANLPVTRESPVSYTVSISTGFGLNRGKEQVGSVRLSLPTEPGLRVNLDVLPNTDPKAKTASLEWVEEAGAPVVVDKSDGIETKVVPTGPNRAKLLIRTHKSPTDGGFVVLQTSRTHVSKLVSFNEGRSHHPYSVISETDSKWKDFSFTRISTGAKTTPAQIRINPEGRYRLLSITKSGNVEGITIRPTTDDMEPVAVDVLGESGVRFSQLFVPNLNG